MLWKIKPQKNLGLMLAHLFGLSILLLQAIIQRVEFFKNITVGAEPEFSLIRLGNAVSFPGKWAAIRTKLLTAQGTVIGCSCKLWAGFWYPCFMH
jgi:hypothetical protein